MAVVEANQSIRILESFEQPLTEFDSTDSSGVIDVPAATPSIEEQSQTDTLPSISENETKIPAPTFDQLPAEDVNREGVLVLSQSPLILLLIIGLAVLAIPFVIWLSRHNRTGS